MLTMEVLGVSFFICRKKVKYFKYFMFLVLFISILFDHFAIRELYLLILFMCKDKNSHIAIFLFSILI